MVTQAVVWRIKAHMSYIQRNHGAFKIRTYEGDPNQPMPRPHPNWLETEFQCKLIQYTYWMQPLHS